MTTNGLAVLAALLLATICGCGPQPSARQDSFESGQNNTPSAKSKPSEQWLIGEWEIDVNATLELDAFKKLQQENPDSVKRLREVSRTRLVFEKGGVLNLVMAGQKLELRYRLDHSNGNSVAVTIQEPLLGTDETRDTKLTYTFRNENTMESSGSPIESRVYRRIK